MDVSSRGAADVGYASPLGPASADRPNDTGAGAAQDQVTTSAALAVGVFPLRPLYVKNLS